MKAFIATVSLTLALPVAVSAQPAAGTAGGGSIAPGSAGRAGVGAVNSPGVGQPLTGTRNPAQTPVTVPGRPVTVPGAPVQVEPLNPGGLRGLPPATAGRTFGRPVIPGTTGGPMTNTILPQPAPPNTLTNGLTGSTVDRFPEPLGFPPGSPVQVGNTVGTNFGRLTSPVPREPVAVNLPPGARVVTNLTGVPEVVVPAPGIVGTSVGGATGLERGTRSGVIPGAVPTRPATTPRGVRVVEPNR